MKPTGIVRDPIYLKHEMGECHPENPQRLQVIYAMLDELRPFLNIVEIQGRIALLEEIAANHDFRYVNRIAATAGLENTFLDPDTSACAHSWEAASSAVGGLFNLIDAVLGGTVRNGFAFVRPPGHHAERRRAMGFCFFNNIAVGARYALSRYGVERIAIVDWDLHHGNGTQNSFYEDSNVLFISTHQYPHYPGTGGIRETGFGTGEGYTINIPISAGAGDLEYATIFHTILVPILKSYRPQLIMVSAGFDAHQSDPLGGMALTEDGYEQMVQILMHLAHELCDSRLILALEGGYNLTALRDSVSRILAVMGAYDPSSDNLPFQPSFDLLTPSFKNRLKDIISVQKKFWPDLPSF